MYDKFLRSSRKKYFKVFTWQCAYGKHTGNSIFSMLITLLNADALSGFIFS